MILLKNQREAGMGLGSELEHADRFAAYVNELTKVLGSCGLFERSRFGIIAQVCWRQRAGAA
jgi:hypothetical protein